MHWTNKDRGTLRQLVSFLFWVLQVAADQGQQVGGRLVAGGQAAVQRFQVPPADGSLNVLNGLSLLEETPQRLAIHRIARL